MRDSISERHVAGIAGQDEAAIAACFAEDAEFCALIPSGLRERSGAAQAAGLISAWFEDSTERRRSKIEDKVRISYRFAGVEEGQPYTVEQQLFCVVRDAKIERADLLCSGFRPDLPR